MSKIPEALSGAALDSYQSHKGNLEEAQAMLDECSQEIDSLKTDKSKTESLIDASRDVDFITNSSIRVNVINDRLAELAHEAESIREVLQLRSMQFNRFVSSMDNRVAEIQSIQHEIQAWERMMEWHRGFLDGSSKQVARPKLGPKQKASQDQVNAMIWTIHEQEKSDD